VPADSNRTDAVDSSVALAYDETHLVLGPSV